MRRAPTYDVAFYMPWIAPLLAQAADALPPGGAETQILLLSQSLVEAGLRVCIITCDIPSGVPTRVGGVDVRVRRPFAGGSQRRYVGKVVEGLAILRAVMGCRSRVVVQRTAGAVTGFVGISAKLTRKTFVWSSANVSDFRHEQIVTTRRDLRLFQLGVRLADKVIVQTDEQVELCRERFRREPVRIFSLAEEAPAAPADRGPFLWIGRLVDYKQPLDYLELARRLPDLAFDMVGVPTPGTDAELVAEVRATAAELANVRMLDPRPRQQLLELINGATAVVNTATFEGMPNIFLEGWARGIPALCLRHDPDGVIQTFGVGLYASGDYDLMATQARRLSEDRDLRLRMCDTCRAYLAERHGPRVVAAAWMDAMDLAA